MRSAVEDYSAIGIRHNARGNYTYSYADEIVFNFNRLLPQPHCKAAFSLGICGRSLIICVTLAELILTMAL